MIIWRGWGALPIVIAALCIGLGGLMSTLNKGLFGVFAGFARSCRGELIAIDRSVNINVKTSAEMNSMKTRSGQTRSSSSR